MKRIWEVKYRLTRKKDGEFLGHGDDLVQANTSKEAEDVLNNSYKGNCTLTVVQVVFLGVLINE